MLVMISQGPCMFYIRRLTSAGPAVRLQCVARVTETAEATLSVHAAVGAGPVVQPTLIYICH